MTRDTIFPEAADQLTRTFEWKALVIAIISTIVVFGFKKVNVMWTILGGAALGYVLHLL